MGNPSFSWCGVAGLNANRDAARHRNRDAAPARLGVERGTTTMRRLLISVLLAALAALPAVSAFASNSWD